LIYRKAPRAIACRLQFARKNVRATALAGPSRIGASLRVSLMTRMIEILREEHRNIEKLLLVLEQELSVFARRERPDYEVMRAVIDYFQDYPDRCHHPKEDLIFARLQARDPDTAAGIGDLEGEHKQGTERLYRLARTLDSILTDHDLRRETFDTVVRDFIDSERQHIAMEEHRLFPAALRTLRQEDWAAIEARLNDAGDPLFATPVEAKFNALRQRILQWEQENEAERALSAPAG
jgi:hemerythrin-like domain-containing protein